MTPDTAPTPSAAATGLLVIKFSRAAIGGCLAIGDSAPTTLKWQVQGFGCEISALKLLFKVAVDHISRSIESR